MFVLQKNKINMKKNKLKTVKKLTRNDLKNVSGGQGNCTPGLWVYVYRTEYADGSPVSTGGEDGGMVLEYQPGTC